MTLPGEGLGAGGAGGGGTSSSGSTSESFSDDGSTSDAFADSNYVETYDSNGDLYCQGYGSSDSDVYSYDVVNEDGSQFSMDMPSIPSDFVGDYIIAVAGGEITIDFSNSLSAVPSYTANGGTPQTSPSISVNPSTTTVGDFNFDGTGQSYACQRARLWQATIIAAIIVGGGSAMAAVPVSVATGALIATTVAAMAQINASKAYLNSIGCPTAQ